MSEKVAVVGGTGFLGTNLVVALADAGYTPIVVARRPERVAQVLPGLAVEARYGDITNPDSLRTALQGCTYVHTLAAMMGDIFTSPNPNQREAAVRVNVDGTLNVLRAAHEAGAKRVVVTSSCTTRYQPGGALANEGSPAIGDQIVPDAYVRSKVLEEKAIAEFSQRTGLEVVAILPGGLVGPRDASPTPMGAVTLARLNGEPTGGISLEGAFPLVDVRDVSRAHVRAMEIENPREAYLIVAQTMDAQEWDRLFRRVSGLPAATRIIPASIAMPMALVFESIAWLKRKPAPLNRNAVRHVVQRQQYDCTLACDELGITYRPVEVTVRDTIRWYVDNGWVTNEENLPTIKETLAAADGTAGQPPIPRPLPPQGGKGSLDPP
jgi:dihydroflavonol-4-reductase